MRWWLAWIIVFNNIIDGKSHGFARIRCTGNGSNWTMYRHNEDHGNACSLSLSCVRTHSFNSIMFDLPFDCFINFFFSRLILTRWFSRITTAKAIEEYLFSLSLSFSFSLVRSFVFFSLYLAHIHEERKRRECELICAELPSSSSSYQMTPEAIDNVSCSILIGSKFSKRHRNDLKAIIFFSRSPSLSLVSSWTIMIIVERRETWSIINWVVALRGGPIIIVFSYLLFERRRRSQNEVSK